MLRFLETFPFQKQRGTPLMAKVLRHRLFDMKLRDPQLFEPIAQTNEAETGPSFRDRKSLDTLPNEILLHIFGFITDPDDILKSDIMGRQNVNTLCDLALTCRRFKPIAQEVMVNTIAMKADDIGCKECNGLCTQTRLIILIKFLLAYPWLQEKVRALRIEVGQKREFPRYVPFFDNFMWNCAYLALNTNLADPYNNEQWVVALDDGYEPAFVGILLCLMPRLEQLILLPKSSDGARKTSPTMLELFGLDHETDSQSGRSWTSFRTPGLENLTHATFRSDWLPRGLNALNGLTSVDLFIGSGHAFEISEEYLYITSLRLNIAFEWIRAPHQPGCSTDYDDTFRNIKRLLPTLPHLEKFHLYSDLDVTWNYDTDQLWSNTLCVCDRPFHFDYILNELYYACKDTITEIGLPSNWYRTNPSTHALTRKMPAFPHLTVLYAPECALKGTDDKLERPEWGPLTVPEAVGSTLETLHIYDPSVGGNAPNIENLCGWVVKLFQDNNHIKSAIPALKRLYIIVAKKKQELFKTLNFKTIAAFLALTKDKELEITLECHDGPLVFLDGSVEAGTPGDSFLALLDY